MKHLTRPQIHAYALCYLAAFIVGLSIGLAMLAHATMAGGPQWSAGALAGVMATGLITAFVMLIVGFTAAVEWLGRGHRREQPRTDRRAVTHDAEAYEGAQSLAGQLVGRHDADDGVPPHWAERTAHEIVYELDDADLDELVAQRSRRRRHAAGHR